MKIRVSCGDKAGRKKRWLIVFVLFSLIAAGLAISGKDEKKETSGRDTQGQIFYYKGEKYRKNPDIETILLLGIDAETDSEKPKNPGENGQSDSISLFVLDKETKKGTILLISRDTLVELEIYDIRGEKLTSVPGQIAMQYAYGDGKQKSCMLVKNKVSELLGGIEIDYYASLHLEAISKMTEAIGGVLITVPGDYTQINPKFRKGNQVLLDGGLAEQYVRGRDTGQLDSNIERMERQAQFLEAFIKQGSEKIGSSEDTIVYEQLTSCVTTNLGWSEIQRIKEYEITEEYLALPGNIIEKDGYAQFIPDAEQLQEMIFQLFYIEEPKVNTK